MTREIPLTQGYVTLIDEADFDLVKELSWHASREPGGIYAKARKPRGGDAYFKLHRFIMGEPPGALVDHINGNTLDNRRANLRPCSNAQNLQNTAQRSDSRSPYKGVERRGNVWRARIREGSAYRSLGHFKTSEEAALVYDAAARRLFGEFACVNFPIHPGERCAIARVADHS